MTDSSSNALQLMQSYPSEQFEMECSLVAFELVDSLHLQADVIVNGKAAKAVVTMNDGFLLEIEPSGIGFAGYPTWFHQTRVRDFTSRESKSAHEVQATVTLLSLAENAEAPSLITSFSDRGLGIEHLLRRTLAKIEKYCDIRLVPLPVVRTNEK